MSKRIDRNQGDMFPGPEIGGCVYPLYLANWLLQKAVPQLIRTVNDLDDAGEMQPELARQTRLGLLYVERRLRGIDDE